MAVTGDWMVYAFLSLHKDMSSECFIYFKNVHKNRKRGGRGGAGDQLSIKKQDLSHCCPSSIGRWTTPFPGVPVDYFIPTTLSSTSLHT